MSIGRADTSPRGSQAIHRSARFGCRYTISPFRLRRAVRWLPGGIPGAVHEPTRMQAAGTIDYSEEHHMYGGATASSDPHARATRPRCRCWGRDPYSSLRICMYDHCSYCAAPPEYFEHEPVRHPRSFCRSESVRRRAWPSPSGRACHLVHSLVCQATGSARSTVGLRHLRTLGVRVTYKMPTEYRTVHDLRACSVRRAVRTTTATCGCAVRMGQRVRRCLRPSNRKRSIGRTSF